MASRELGHSRSIKCDALTSTDIEDPEGRAAIDRRNGSLSLSRAASRAGSGLPQPVCTMHSCNSGKAAIDSSFLVQSANYCGSVLLISTCR